MRGCQTSPAAAALKEEHEKLQNKKRQSRSSTREAICAFIQKSHDEYLAHKHGVEDDVEHIVEVNHKALDAMMKLLANKRAEWRIRHLVMSKNDGLFSLIFVFGHSNINECKAGSEEQIYVGMPTFSAMLTSDIGILKVLRRIHMNRIYELQKKIEDGETRVG